MATLITEIVNGEPYHYYPLGDYVVRAIGVCGGRPTFKYTLHALKSRGLSNDWRLARVLTPSLRDIVGESRAQLSWKRYG